MRERSAASDIIVRSETGIEREHLVRTASTCWCIPATSCGPATIGRWAAGAARHSADSGEEAVQQYLIREIQNVYPANESKSTTSTSRSSLPDAPQGARSNRPATPTFAGHRDRQVRLPPSQRKRGAMLEDHRKGDTDFEPDAIVPRTPRQANAQSKPWGRRRPKAAGPRRRPPDATAWGSPRPRCRARASSRPRASRKPPRCLPKRPWPEGRPPGGPQRKRDSGPPDSCRTGFRTSRRRKFASGPSPRGPGGREGPRYWNDSFPLLETDRWRRRHWTANCRPNCGHTESSQQLGRRLLGDGSPNRPRRWTPRARRNHE